MRKDSLRKIKKLCRKFADDLQKIYDEEFDEETARHEIYDLATAAQGYAEDVAETEI